MLSTAFAQSKSGALPSGALRQAASLPAPLPLVTSWQTTLPGLSPGPCNSSMR